MKLDCEAYLSVVKQSSRGIKIYPKDTEGYVISVHQYFHQTTYSCIDLP